MASLPTNEVLGVAEDAQNDINPKRDRSPLSTIDDPPAKRVRPSSPEDAKPTDDQDSRPPLKLRFSKPATNSHRSEPEPSSVESSNLSTATRSSGAVQPVLSPSAGEPPQNDADTETRVVSELHKELQSDYEHSELSSGHDSDAQSLQLTAAPCKPPVAVGVADVSNNATVLRRSARLNKIASSCNLLENTQDDAVPHASKPMKTSTLTERGTTGPIATADASSSLDEDAMIVEEVKTSVATDRPSKGAKKKSGIVLQENQDGAKEFESIQGNASSAQSPTDNITVGLPQLENNSQAEAKLRSPPAKTARTRGQNKAKGTSTRKPRTRSLKSGPKKKPTKTSDDEPDNEPDYEPDDEPDDEPDEEPDNGPDNESDNEPDDEMEVVHEKKRVKTSEECLENVDAKLIQMSNQLTLRENERPQPQGKPIVWALSRQPLCETLNYFKKPQGGCHSNDRHVYAFLYDCEAKAREYMDSEVVIARAGGAMKPGPDGVLHQIEDHKMTHSQVQGMLNDITLQNPVVLIVGNQNTAHPSCMPHRYCVLGWYKPVAVWAEKLPGRKGLPFTSIRFRFERLQDTNQAAWHAPSNSVVAPNLDEQVEGLKTDQCSHCEKFWPQVYLEGWMCLTADCTRFWMIGEDDAPCQDLTFNPAFLCDRTPWADETAPYDLARPLPDVENAVGDNLTYVNTRGIICPECGMCNSRYLWRGWVCDNTSCTWEGYFPKHAPITPALLHSPWDTQGDGPTLARNKHEPEVNVQVFHLHGYKVVQYTFDGIEGSFVHAIANERINQEEGGPNDMLTALQTQDLDLQRRRFAVEKCSGGKPKTKTKTKTGPDNGVNKGSQSVAPREKGDFMTAFSMNYGMPYKFVASGASKSFDEAPDVIRACRSRLNWAANTFLGGTVSKGNNGFNELLVFAYMQAQKLDYHDDGEEGLGPCIASLSLGCKAQMQLRIKAKHYSGFSKGGKLTADKPLKMCAGGENVYGQRLESWKELQCQTTARAAATMQNAAGAKVKGLVYPQGKGRGHPKPSVDLVNITLGHGDIMLMCGYDIQKYMEHKVTSEGLMRFALTCREVLPGHLAPHELPPYEVKPDTYGYDGSKLFADENH